MKTAIVFIVGFWLGLLPMYLASHNELATSKQVIAKQATLISRHSNELLQAKYKGERRGIAICEMFAEYGVAKANYGVAK